MIGKATTLRRKLTIAALIVSCLWIAFGQLARGQSSSAPKYTASGELILPRGFETWVFVGSNLGLAYREELPTMTALEATRADQPQFHNIYLDTAAYDHFRTTGEFPDRTVIVMDVFAAADKEPQNVVAKGVFNGARIGMEVAVKNSARPDGKKTVWAYYDFTDRSDPSKLKATAPAFPDESCETCHRQHAGRDHVWVQFYPTLRELIK